MCQAWPDVSLSSLGHLAWRILAAACVILSPFAHASIFPICINLFVLRRFASSLLQPQSLAIDFTLQLRRVSNETAPLRTLAHDDSCLLSPRQLCLPLHVISTFNFLHIPSPAIERLDGVRAHASALICGLPAITPDLEPHLSVCHLSIATALLRISLKT